MEELDKILTEWRHTRQQMLEEDPNYALPDEIMQHILMRIIPQTLVEEMRRKLDKW